MDQFQIPFGKRLLEFSLPGAQVDVILPNNHPPASDELATTREALELMFSRDVVGKFSKCRSAALAINDKTRPVPYDIILPTLIDKLNRIGIEDRKITLFIATGTHTPAREIEIKSIVPPSVRNRVRIVSHDCDDQENLRFLGVTSRQTSVYINQKFLNTDLRIVTGNIELHHFMGFSGGAKTGSIGLAGRSTINQNHAMLLDPNAKMGIYERNPMRQDVEEIGDMMQIQIAVNTILTSDKKIITVVAGSPRSVMKAGIPLSRQISQTRISHKYDMVIASAGGHPKDINLYQAQKAITHAVEFAQPGAPILLAAECPDGSGSRSFEDFMVSSKNLEDVVNKFHQQGFQVGPHKALQLAIQCQRNPIYLLSNLDENLARSFFLTPVKSIDQGLKRALETLPTAPRIVVLPHATGTIAFSEIDGEM